MDKGSQDPQERLACATREFGEFGGVNASVECSTTFTVLKADTLPDIFSGKIGPANGGCYLYGRSFNPTVRYLGRQLAALEGAEDAYCTSSGMGAISAALLNLCDSGDHIVASSTIYGGTFALIKEFLPRKCGITATLVDITDLDAVAAAITPRTRVVYCETVANPTLVVADLPALADIAHAAGAELVVDNTFAPMQVSPLRWGADVVVHSLTKYISGASDVVAGAVCGRSSFITRLMDLHLGPLMLLGPTMDPRVASDLSLRIPNLALRVREHAARAGAYAGRLADLGAKVCYPGLPSHPQHALIVRLSNPGYGFGGMVAVDMGSRERANVLIERLQNKHGFGLMAVSLGYYDTLLSVSAGSTSSELTDEELEAAGIAPGLVRISAGITGTLDGRLRQLEEAYAAVAGAPVGAKPTHSAARYRRAADGTAVKRTPSWRTFGVGNDSEGVEEEGKAEEGRGSSASSDVASNTEDGTSAPRPAQERVPHVHKAHSREGDFIRYAPLAQ